MKKLLCGAMLLTLATACVVMLSACSSRGKSTTTIDNLQEYLPNVQSKTIAWDIDGNNTMEKLYQYTYENDNSVDWTETDRLNGELDSEIFGYDYYVSSDRELRRNTISDNSPTAGDYTILINKVGKEFVSYDGTRTILSSNETITVPAGTFNNCIYVKVEADGLEAYRYYAPGLGEVYSIANMGDMMYYEEFMSSYQSVAATDIIYNDEIEAVEDDTYRWYLKKSTFENTDTNHTLYVEVAGDTLRFIMDGQFLGGTANLDETDYFTDYLGYTANEDNGTFTVRYYPDNGNIRIIDNVDDTVDYSGVYEYKNE